MSERSTGPLLVLGAAILWGTTGTAQALGPASAEPLAVGTIRLIVGGVGLVAVALVAGRMRPEGPLPFRTVAVTAVGIAAYQPLFFAGVDRAGVALGTVVAIGSGPVFAGLISAALHGWRPDRRWLAATALATIGVTAIVGPGGGSEPLGVLMAAGSGACYASFAVGSKVLLNHLSPLGTMGWGFGGGALLLAPVLLFTDLGWIGSPAGLGSALWLGLAATTASYTLFGYGLRRVDVPVAATLALAEPLTAALLGVVLLTERPTLIGWLGAVLVFTGLVIASWRTSRTTAARTLGR